MPIGNVIPSFGNRGGFASALRSATVVAPVASPLRMATAPASVAPTLDRASFVASKEESGGGVSPVVIVGGVAAVGLAALLAYKLTR